MTRASFGNSSAPATFIRIFPEFVGDFLSALFASFASFASFGTVMSIDTGVSVTLANTGLNVRDGGGDHNLRIRPAEDLTADRVA